MQLRGLWEDNRNPLLTLIELTAKVRVGYVHCVGSKRRLGFPELLHCSCVATLVPPVASSQCSLTS